VKSTSVRQSNTLPSFGQLACFLSKNIEKQSEMRVINILLTGIIIVVHAPVSLVTVSAAQIADKGIYQGPNRPKRTILQKRSATCQFYEHDRLSGNILTDSKGQPKCFSGCAV
jgi:hypothetical protein